MEDQMTYVENEKLKKICKHQEELIKVLEEKVEVIHNALKDIVGVDFKDNGLMLVATERRRQIEVEGFTIEHNIQHRNEELAAAAAVYAAPILSRLDLNLKLTLWPATWSNNWYKPTPDNRIRELVKSAALSIAEIDRLIALGEKVQTA